MFKYSSFFIIFGFCSLVVKSNYELTIKDFEVMFPNDTTNMNKIKMKRINRTHPHFLFGEVETFRDFGNEIEVEGKLFKMQGYEYREMPYKFKRKLCDQFSDQVFAYEFMKSTDIPKDKV